MKRPCVYCGERFEKTGKFNKVCYDCSRLNMLLKENKLDILCKAKVGYIIKHDYLPRDRVTMCFRNIRQDILKKQLWFIDEKTKQQYSVTKFIDLNAILDVEMKKLEVDAE